LLPSALNPEWTRGSEFGVRLAIISEQEVEEPLTGSWLISVKNGAPVKVTSGLTNPNFDAEIEMSVPAFYGFLSGNRMPSGERPTIRGDRVSVARLTEWLELILR
jgi:hypothetical protein